uniref:von Willebrand factor A domain-containing protein 5A-like n=1 Tax=Centroberyx gerrardi TaxID=166262 RepID=UPI003AAD8A97
MQPKVMQSLRFALQPAVVDISVTWDLPKGVSVTPLSPSITTLFHGQRSLLYAQLTGKSSGATEGCVTVNYSLAGHPSKNQIHFSLKPTEDTGLTVHRLGARTLIRSLEMEEREHRGQQNRGVKEKVVELSVQSGVSSAFTAFIAVNKGSGEAVKGPLLRRNVPTPSNRGMSLCASEDPQPSLMPPREPLLQLISLQKASGSWVLEPALATVLGKTSEEVEKPKPASVNQEVWATILALIWLHGFKMEAREEWELLAMKAVSWLHTQKAPCVTECVEAGNALLGCKVQKDTLGL